MKRNCFVLVAMFCVASLVVAQISAIESEQGPTKKDFMRVRVHTTNEIVACWEEDDLEKFFNHSLKLVRDDPNAQISWPPLLADFKCALLRTGDEAIMLGVGADGHEIEGFADIGEFDLDKDTYIILKVEVIPTPNENEIMFIRTGGEMVRISGKGTMWVILKYLEKYTWVV